MAKQIVFTKVNTAELIDVEESMILPRQVAVRTEFSTISNGTERANITGDANITIDSEENEPVVFPRASGYSSSGTVIAKGSDVKSVDIGDKVAMSWSLHKNVNIIPEEYVEKIYDGKISMQEAAICHIATFPMAAIRKTMLEIGESMMIMGLGILGLAAVQLAKAAGAVPVIAVDPILIRREKALNLGADHVFDPCNIDFITKVKELTGGGVNTAVEVTGLGEGLNQCLDCMVKFGRIALLGCTRNSNFTVDYYRKVHGPGIQIIGAHTAARPSKESYPGYFTQKDDMKAMLKLCAAKRICLKDMEDAVYSPKDCSEVYKRLINDKNCPAVVQFDWRDIK